MNPQYTPDNRLVEFRLYSEGCFGRSFETYKPLDYGTFTPALLGQQAEISSINWREYVAGLECWCNLSGNHIRPEVYPELAQCLINSGSKIVRFNLWESIHGLDWNLSASPVFYRQEVLDVTA